MHVVSGAWQWSRDGWLKSSARMGIERSCKTMSSVSTRLTSCSRTICLMFFVVCVSLWLSAVMFVKHFGFFWTKPENWVTNVGTFRLKVLSKLIIARNKQISYKCKDVLDDYPPLAKTEIQDNRIEQGPTFHTWWRVIFRWCVCVRGLTLPQY